LVLAQPDSVIVLVFLLLLILSLFPLNPERSGDYFPLPPRQGIGVILAAAATAALLLCLAELMIERADLHEIDVAGRFSRTVPVIIVSSFGIVGHEVAGL